MFLDRADRDRGSGSRTFGTVSAFVVLYLYRGRGPCYLTAASSPFYNCEEGSQEKFG